MPRLRTTTATEDSEFAQKLADEILPGITAGWVLKWVTDNFLPEQIYEVEILADWAEANGFVEEE